MLSHQNHFGSGEEELRAEEQLIENAKRYFREIKTFLKGIIYLLADLTCIKRFKKRAKSKHEEIDSKDGQRSI